MHIPQRFRLLKASVFLIAPLKRLMLPLGILILLVQLFQFINPYLFKEIIDGFIDLESTGAKRLLTLIAVSFGVSIVMTFFKVARDRKIFNFMLLLERDIPIKAQKKLVGLPLSYHEKKNTGDMIVKVQRGADIFSNLISSFLFDFFPTALQTIATFVFLLVLSWPIALVFISVVPIFVWYTVRLNRRVLPLRKRRHRGYERAAGVMAQAMMNIHAVLSFRQEPREVRELSTIRDDIYRTESKEWDTVVIRGGMIRDNLINVGRIAVLLTSVWMAFQGSITIGSLVLFLMVSEQAYFALFSIYRIFDITSEGAEAVIRLNTLLHETPEIQDRPDARPLVSPKGEVTFEDVTFNYGDGCQALDNVSFTVEPGETIALVGPSGSGKSTIAKVLFRHYDVTSGSIRLDGRDIRSLTLTSVRGALAIVPQDVEIFNRSIRDNIAYANAKASERDIIHAALLANADCFIRELPKGYETLVGERGVKLSGGQRQRVGIARAVLANPTILVFDEATSQLDSESERLIQSALERFRRGRTTIIIAHRLSTIRRADKILVFDKGRIIEAGDHKRLLRHNGLYAQLHRLQVEGIVK